MIKTQLAEKRSRNKLKRDKEIWKKVLKILKTK